MDRLTDPRPSPGGEEIVFVRRVTDIEADTGRTDLWKIGAEGGEPQRLTRHEAADSSPRWSADGSTIYFLSSRSGSSQVWKLPASGEPVQVTDLPLDVSN
jgi:Tol biopolymer transport system component